MVNFLTLDGNIRKDLGSANTNKLRKEGKIPAVIYSDDKTENTYISISKKDFDKEYLKTNIQLKPIELNIDSKKYKVLTYQIDINPVTDMPRHIDFLNIDKKKEVKVYIPINFIGREKSPGIKKGGFLNVLKRKIQCYVDPLNIPQAIELLVSEMHIGDKIKIEDIKLPSGLKAVDKSNFNICSVTGRGKSVEETSATTDSTTATPVSAAGTPAASNAKAADSKASAAKPADTKSTAKK